MRAVLPLSPSFFHLSFRFSPFPLFVFALFFISALPPFFLRPFLLLLCNSFPFFHVFSSLCILFPFSSFRVPIRGASSRLREYSFPYSKEQKTVFLSISLFRLPKKQTVFCVFFVFVPLSALYLSTVKSIYLGFL